MILETPRLIIRELNIKDVDSIFALDSNTSVHNYLGKNPIKSKAEALENLNYILQQYKVRGIGRFAVIDKESGNFLGWSGLKLNMGIKESLNGYVDFIDIGYRLLQKYWGNGYASEAAFACLEYGFRVKNYETIYGAADVNNIASNRILKKIGLQFKNCFTYNYKNHSVQVNWYQLNNKDYGK